ncbi:MAG TPA: hypothetical protein VMX56_08305 [Anaerolineales bacterium]|nr:hypothetical protein [Anaerolineales bacterium]
MSRILKDLQSKGFTGSRSALYRHIEQPQREAQNTKTYQPDETRPGEQSQYDDANVMVLLCEIAHFHKHIQGRHHI